MRAGAQLLGGARRLFRDKGGVAALEFALIVPLLLMLYFVTMEVAQAIEVNKKVGRVGSMVADLVTQMQEMNKAELEGIMRIGEATLQPYNRSQPNITITRIKGSFLIRAESSLEYEPVITWAASSKTTLGLASAFDGISMGETYYLRPRMSMTIPCTNCY